MKKRTITIGDKEVAMKATALTPRLYRFTFGTDMISDIRRLQRSIKSGDFDLATLEQVAWTMAKQADAATPKIEDWLDTFGVTDIYYAMKDILGIWAESNATTAAEKNQ